MARRSRFDDLPDEMLRVINEYVVEVPDPCPFLTYKATKSPPSRHRRANLVQWRGDVYLFSPKPLVERRSDDDDYRYDYVFDLVRLSDNRVLTSPKLRVGEDAVAVEANASNLLAVQFDDDEPIDNPFDDTNPENPTVSGTARFYRCRHFCFDVDDDQLVLVEQRFEVNGDAENLVKKYYNRFAVWSGGRARIFEDEISFYVLESNTNLTYQRYAYWYEPRDEPAYEDDDPESGWKLQSEPHGNPPEGLLRVAAFFFKRHTTFHVHGDYALCEDNETVRVLDLSVMHEIVRLKDRVQSIPNVSSAAASTTASRALLAFDNHWNNDVHDKVQNLINNYSSARKRCFATNMRRLLRNSLPPSMAHLARRAPATPLSRPLSTPLSRPIRTQFGVQPQ